MEDVVAHWLKMWWLIGGRCDGSLVEDVVEEEHPKKQPAEVDLSEELLDMPSDEEMETGKLPSSESSKDATSAKGQGDRKQST